ncbi:hypothetical protein BJ912DRAFT_928389 [Pholiota molesta]|nr:hypothetical protein BJ912DRAFT_928389 [Pholiota molesta]
MATRAGGEHRPISVHRIMGRGHLPNLNAPVTYDHSSLNVHIKRANANGRGLYTYHTPPRTAPRAPDTASPRNAPCQPARARNGACGSERGGGILTSKDRACTLWLREASRNRTSERAVARVKATAGGRRRRRRPEMRTTTTCCRGGGGEKHQRDVAVHPEGPPLACVVPASNMTRASNTLRNASAAQRTPHRSATNQPIKHGAFPMHPPPHPPWSSCDRRSLTTASTDLGATSTGEPQQARNQASKLARGSHAIQLLPLSSLDTSAHERRRDVCGYQIAHDAKHIDSKARPGADGKGIENGAKNAQRMEAQGRLRGWKGTKGGWAGEDKREGLLLPLSPTSGPPRSFVQPASCLRGVLGGAAEPRIIPSSLVKSSITKYGSTDLPPRRLFLPAMILNRLKATARPLRPSRRLSQHNQPRHASIRSPCSLRQTSHRRRVSGTPTTLAALDVYSGDTSMEEWTILELDVAGVRFF